MSETPASGGLHGEGTLDVRAEIARIDHARAEARRLLEEAMKFQEDWRLAPWVLVVSGMTAAAALFAAGVTWLFH